MTDPFTMSVTLTIQPERREEFLGALDAVLGPARAEPGCVFLHVGESTERRGTFVLFERWRDPQGYFEEILRRAHFQQYLATSEAAYATPRVVVLLDPAGPEDSSS